MKLKKRLVEEEVIQLSQEIEDQEQFDGAANVATFTALISNLVKDEWEAIDGYNQAIVTMNAMGGNQKVIDTLQDILKEEYIHIGQLEKTLQMVIPEANEMESGEEEAEEGEPEDEIPEEEISVESDEDEDGEFEESLSEGCHKKVNEEEELPDDDIPEDVADKLNFEKKSED